MDIKKTSIIILTNNKLTFLQMCVDHIRRYTKDVSYEIIVVDNNSTDGTVEWLEAQDDIRAIFNKDNYGFPKGCNQGIGIAEGESILLLNNDVLVTPNWLKNLSLCLYSSADIGAVGAVTNNCSYYQTIPADYQNIDQMITFAEGINLSDSKEWEERIKLIGFCFLVKKEVITRVGLLDERFSPGNFEDDDFSFRMKEAGYRLMLCKDTFVHHFGSVSFRDEAHAFSTIYYTNQKKFEEKWGFIPEYHSNIRYDIRDLIDESLDKPIAVLEVGCGCGATLMHIKNKYKSAQIYGIELNEGAANIAKTFAEIIAGDIEKTVLNYKDNYFDYILFCDVLEHLKEPSTVLKNIYKYLKPNGKVLASIPNVMHYSVIRNLLNGFWTYEDSGILDKTHLRFFTLTEIKNMFKGAGYKYIEYTGKGLIKSEEDKQYILNLSSLTSQDLAKQFEVYQYITKAYVNANVPARVKDINIKEISL